MALAILFTNVDAATTAHVDVVGLMAGATIGEGESDAAVGPESTRPFTSRFMALAARLRSRIGR